MAASRRAPLKMPALDLADALVVNLNAMVGAGVFVALGMGADLAGPALLAAVVGAGALAVVAASAPRPRLTGEAARRVSRVSALLTLMAGIPAAAAVARMGAAYVVPTGSAVVQRGIAGALVVAVALAVAGGFRSTARIAGVFLAVKVGALAFFAGLALPLLDRANFHHALPSGGKGVWQAAALMVFACAGFGRASETSAESPRAAAPVSVLVATALYMVVAFAAIGLGGLLFSAKDLAGNPYNAPLLIPASFTNFPAVARAALTLGAVAAAVSVLYTLLDGAARAVPEWLAKPPVGGAMALMAAAAMAVALSAFATVSALIAFSAMAVLVLFALRLAAGGRLGLRLIAVAVLLMALALPASVVTLAGTVLVIGAAGVLVPQRSR